MNQKRFRRLYREENKRGHRLILDRLVEGAFEVACHLLHTLACLATLVGHAVGHALGLISRLAELIRRLVFRSEILSDAP